ncbi:Ni/Fe-hydrogenase, b-type cytochrome subunit [Desulfuribacillus stibiiarsenatis]|uniref:Ni/Fe-hydrogenase, b-type cytochrome subunit n=1 Tax=Desulfuribacillus stibiiarsenatis TaxID=1390249 RepID=A0A1E5L911_9FIRM|nr:Ni/Fe-hydrogenase, b-type cytochrome subunit [Desulfuribacillus stibiiarsenatis]OEH86647.1 Ni/Fe-hydrogenase, b-type cytochrome subunit [Desulfuribacillus stibiiarsenatis]
MTNNGLKKDVYVWELPVRFFHWVNALCIVVLLATGYFIYNPFLHAPGTEANDYFVMGTARFVHFVTAYVFIANLLFRFYWFFAGNQYAKIKFWKKEWWIGLKDVILFYLFIKKEEPHFTGHNPLAEISYLFFIWVGSFFIILTGLTMQAEIYTTGFLYDITSWFASMMSNSVNTRVLHHMLAWSFVLFIVAHLYTALRHDFLSKSGATSSIITGYKTEETHDADHK